MTEALPGERRGQLVAAAILGCCAAAVSIAPRVAAPLSVALLAVPVLFWILLTPGRWLGLFFFAALLLPPLPVPIGNSGPHPALIFAAAGILAGLLRTSQWRVERDLLNLSLFLFLSVMAASVAPAAVYSGLEVAAGSFARVCLFAISAYVFYYVRAGLDSGAGAFRQTRLLFAAAVAAAGFACLDFYYQLPAPAGYGPQFIWLDSGVFRRAQGLFYEASTLGNFCAFFLVMILVVLVRPARERPMRRIALIVGGVPLAAALVLSYSRASLLGLAAACGALLWLNRSRLRLRRLAIGAAAGVALSALAMALAFPVFAQMYLVRLAASAQYFLTAPELVLSGRLASWRLLLGFLADHPWHALIGVGYKTLPYSNFTGQPTVADNMYLSMLVETGITGLAALLLLCFAMLRASLRAARSPDPRRSLFGAWFFCFWVGQMFQMLSGDLLTYWRVLPIYFWVLAVSVRE